MENHPSKAAAHSQTPSTIMCDPQRIQPFESETQPTPRDKSPLTCWECATCGRRYIDPAATSLFISPPPTTECIMVQTDETWTHEKGGYVNLSITGGATCDYVRINRAVGDADLGEHIAEPEDSASALNIPAVNGLSARVCDSMKVEGEYGRVNRQNKAVDTNCDDANVKHNSCIFNQSLRSSPSNRTHRPTRSRRRTHPRTPTIFKIYDYGHTFTVLDTKGARECIRAAINNAAPHLGELNREVGTGTVFRYEKPRTVCIPSAIDRRQNYNYW
ncbi:hypothetical protein HO173_002433 [Letharia columbiana]|uniref:Uncharacterized protein n=1 Tax=Letharia columbiana TaxID=112416 RepID=A0A8H6L8P3_9LECA|nr:uncharacterized protein HO173_002433 [Letharia columbiana]KAF6239886.1 hypothetical protein HO173_002433 [Letharia columbiana]